MKATLCLLWFFVLSSYGAYAQEKPPDRQRHLAVEAGILYSAERDRAYSPLPYRGLLPAVLLGYGVDKAHRSERFWASYSNGTLANRFGARTEVLTARIFNYTLYERKRAEGSDWRFGWSNNNALSLRDYAEAANFSPRFDYHTSFGPAVGFDRAFGGRLAGLELTVVGHLQLLGFFVQSGYVSAAPDATLGEDIGFGSLLRSVRPFVPGRDWNWGTWSSLRYRLASGTELGLAYRYDMTVLTDSHRSTRSRGHYLFTLIAKL
jgi:hypothetical protein